ncbi:MAG: methionyl-tRNA formyltransferase, partial [Methyloligellaceae bacterium]
NLIRGTDPAPGAWTMNGEVQIQLYASTIAVGEGAPGEVLAVSGDGITIAAGGGAVRVGRVRAAKEKKIDAGEYAQAAGLGAGARLG